MKKVSIPLALILSVLFESVLIFKMLATEDMYWKECYIGFAFLVLIIIIYLIHSLTNIYYGKPK